MVFCQSFNQCFSIQYNVDSNSLYCKGFESTVQTEWMHMKPRLLHLLPQLAVKTVAAGDHHILIMAFDPHTSKHRVYSSGSGKSGELGIGRRISWINHLEPIAFNESVIQISAGSHCSVILSDLHEVYTFGCGAFYRLGHGDDTDRLSPTLVTGLKNVGYTLPSGQTTGIKHVSCGRWHMVALTTDTDDLYGWGWNKFGQLGPKNIKINNEISNSSDIIPFPCRLHSLDRNELLGEDYNITSITCGSRHTAILDSKMEKIVVMGTIGPTTSENTEPRVIFDLSAINLLKASSNYINNYALRYITVGQMQNHNLLESVNDTSNYISIHVLVSPNNETVNQQRILSMHSFMWNLIIEVH